jgi:dihydroorotate dehydrogenase
MIYRALFQLIFRRMPAETAHHFGFALIRAAGKIPGLMALLRRRLLTNDPVLRVSALGLDLPGPLGLAAGFDKDAQAPDALGALGFGFVEVGTVTARPQPGNPKPRLFRLPADRALINRMGFNNAGSTAAATRLRERAEFTPAGEPMAVVGANIGKSKVVAEADAIEDYTASATRLADVADYLVVNVSSPNTPGLRNLQAVEVLRPLLQAVRQSLDNTADRHVPLLVKIAPDLTDEQLDAVADLALELGLDGIIATNTTTSREGLSTSADEVAAIGLGGLSGPPVRTRALEVLQRLRARVGTQMVLIAAGGISSGDDAYERIRAGATLVQAYTAFIYAGPFWPRRVHRELAARLRADGYANVCEAVGTAVPSQQQSQQSQLPRSESGTPE